MKKRYLLLLTIIAYLVVRFSNLDQLLQMPLITPEQFLAQQPYLQWNDWILIQPTSSILVFTLGGLGIWIGIKFWQTKGQELSRYWWSIAMWLWGVSAIAAGLSYQSFGYMFKAYQRTYVLYTSWPEVIYSLLMLGCIGTMSMAVAYTSTSGRIRQLIKYGTIGLCSIYLGITICGVILPQAFLLSFTLLVLFIFPCFVVYFVADIKYYLQHHTLLHFYQIWCWVLLGLLMIAYYAYSLAGVTQMLWQQGWWFSDNDLLHVLLIGWMIYINNKILPNVKDI